MDLFSFATNIQQMALGGVNFVNKFRKKNIVANSNYVTYYVIGEHEKNPNDMNIFFLPFSNVDKIKLSEFKEYFPFKENVIFRFRLVLKDLVEVINEGFQSGVPLLKKKGGIREKTRWKGSPSTHRNEKKELEEEGEDEKEQNESENRKTDQDNITENLSEYIISDELEIKNITKQENGNYVWVDITNEDAHIPLCQGKIVAKVLFIDKENYKSYDDIYFSDFLSERTPLYNVNEKHLCSYSVEQQDVSSTTDCRDTGDQDGKENGKREVEKQENGEVEVIGNVTKEISFMVNSSTVFNSNNTDDSRRNVLDVSKKVKGERSTLSSGSASSSAIFKSRESKSNFDSNDITTNFSNFHKENTHGKVQNTTYMSDTENRTGEQKQKGADSEEKEQERLNRVTHGKKTRLFQNNNSSDDSMEISASASVTANESFVMSNENTQGPRKKNNQSNKGSSDYITTSDRLNKLKESRCEEEKKFKEKILITNKIKKQIDKWCKNSDDTYKDIKVMLSSLHGVLWDNCNWKPVSMSELISNPKFAKKCYKTALILCHPDKHRNKPLEQMVRVTETS